MVSQLFECMKKHSNKEAIIWRDQSTTYKTLLGIIDKWSDTLVQEQIAPYSVVALIGDYSPNAIALVIALIRNKNVIVPQTPLGEAHFEEFFSIARPQIIFDLSREQMQIVKRQESLEQHPLLNQLRQSGNAGVILFTSGSTGHPKAVVHDVEKLMSKFETANKGYRTLVFLMFDHVAGVDTYFYSLFSGGTLVLPASRTPKEVCQLIKK